MSVLSVSMESVFLVSVEFCPSCRVCMALVIVKSVSLLSVESVSLQSVWFMSIVYV
jgi:hypothetical protein